MPARDKRIKTEEGRLRELFEGLQPQEQKVADGLIQRAAFMRVQLEDFEVDMNKHGCVEMFTQSDKTDPYERERPVVRLHNTMVKNYAMVVKQLKDLLPPAQAVKAADELDAFLRVTP